MVNSEEFAIRLKKILDVHQLTASSFADRIGVQRSSISHILSGRNKPSLDFILKVTTTFTDVDMYWLLNGKGTFPKEREKEEQKVTPAPTIPFPEVKKISTEKTIQRIIVLYDDGTFEDYNKM